MKKLFRLALCAVLVFAIVAANLCFASAESKFDSKAEMLEIKNHIEEDAGVSEYAAVQGACTDGTYAYFALMQGGANILKYDVNTWELKDKKKITNVGHANDMTYNSKKKYIVIANNAPYYNIVTLIDAETLNVIKDVELELDIYSIAYNAKRNQYVVGVSGGYDFAVLDEDFEVADEFEGVNTGYTRQGCDCDDNYIYFVQSGGKNNIAVYDYSGAHVANIPMTNSDEVENIFHIGSEYYVSMYYYGSFVYRVGFSSDSRIRYSVSYDSNGGDGEMKTSAVHYGEKTPIAANSFSKDGYFFGGWTVQRDSDGKYIGYRLGSVEYEWLAIDEVDRFLYFDDEEPIAKTVRTGGIKLSARWINESYGIDFVSDEGEGEMNSVTLSYDEALTLPENEFVKEGYVFSGYTAKRSSDGRVYGYRANSDKPEWLLPENAEEKYLFSPNEEVKSLTEDGRVTMTAQFKFAYTFGGDGSTLVEYVGVDEKVVIPANEGELTTLAEGAIKDNSTMTELHIPASVSSLQSGAVTNCPNLKNIYFEGELPNEFDSNCVSGSVSPTVYKLYNGQAFCIGFFADTHSAGLIRCHASALEKAISEQKYG